MAFAKKEMFNVTHVKSQGRDKVRKKSKQWKVLQCSKDPIKTMYSSDCNYFLQDHYKKLDVF